MARSTRHATPRSGSHDRHGRGMRSPVTGPHLDVLRTRSEFFDLCIGSAVQYLRELWPEEMVGVHFDVARAPDGPPGPLGVERWGVNVAERRIVLYRLPIERLAHLHRNDEWHRRSFIESCVFRAVAQLLGKDPWDIAPERYRHF